VRGELVLTAHVMPHGGAPAADRLRACVLLVCGTAAFVYFSFWCLLLPFVDDDQPAHALFPPKHWAVALPAVAGSALCVTAGLAAAFTLVTGR
jgi:dolichyl-phosphate mannosyltransferase polypeptide 2 regulatory subunit